MDLHLISIIANLHEKSPKYPLLLTYRLVIDSCQRAGVPPRDLDSLVEQVVPRRWACH